MALVQEQGGAGNSAAATVVFTFGANFTNGNMLVFCLEENDDATGPSISATGVTWTKQNRFRGDANHDNIVMWTGVVGASAGNAVTITVSSALNAYAGIGAEFNTVQQVVDGTPPTPTNVSSATPSVTSNTPSVSGDLGVAFCGHVDATAPTGTPSTWTTLTRRSSTNSIEGAYLVLPSSSAVTPQWTFAASKFALLEVVLIKSTGGGGGPTVKNLAALGVG